TTSQTAGESCCQTPPGPRTASAIFGFRLGRRRVHLCSLPGAEYPSDGDADLIDTCPVPTAASWRGPVGPFSCPQAAPGNRPNRPRLMPRTFTLEKTRNIGIM